MFNSVLPVCVSELFNESFIFECNIVMYLLALMDIAVMSEAQKHCVSFAPFIVKQFIINTCGLCT